MDAPSTCLNCNEPFGLPKPRFCPACGQESNLRPPRLGEFLQQFGGAYFATEGAMWRTLKLLLLKPGELTRQYLAGRRKHYVLPLRLYLSISVVVLLFMRAMATEQFDVAETDTPKDRPKSVEMRIGTGEVGLKNGVYYCRGLPQWLCKRIQRRMDIEPAKLREEVAGIRKRFVANLGGAMFVLVPTFALWMQLAYWKSRLRYTEHLVFALHVHALWFLLLALIMSGIGPISFLAGLAVPIYTWLAMRRVFGDRWWARLLRTALVSSLYGITLAIALAGLAIWAMLF